MLIDQAWNRAISMQVLPPDTNQGSECLRVAAVAVTTGSIACASPQRNESLLMKADCTFIQTLTLNSFTPLQTHAEADSYTRPET